MKVTFDRTTTPTTIVSQRGRVSFDEFWNVDLGGAKGPSYICQSAVRQHDALAERVGRALPYYLIIGVGARKLVEPLLGDASVDWRQ